MRSNRILLPIGRKIESDTLGRIMFPLIYESPCKRIKSRCFGEVDEENKERE
jgi:hypothetical protein